MIMQYQPRIRRQFAAATIIVVLLLGMAGFGFAQNIREFNMEESVRRALVANNRIRAARYQLFGSEAEEKAAKGAFGPSVNLSYLYTHYDERPQTGGISFGEQDQWDMTLNVRQPLFTGFRLLSEYQRAGLAKELNMAQLKQTELEVILDVQREFLNLLKARENVNSSEDALARLESVLKVANAFYEVGVKPRLDVLQAEVDVARAEQDLLSARNEVLTQEVRVNTLLDYGLEQDINYVGALEYQPVDMNLDQAMEQAFRQRPDITIAEKSVDIGRKEVRLAASGFYPELALNFDYLRQGDDPSVDGTSFEDASEWRVRGELQWTLFEWGQTYYSHKASQENVGRLDAELRSLQREIIFEVKAAYLGVLEAEERILAARKGVEAAREGFRMAQERYRNQVGTYTDVLDAQASLSEAEADLTSALADYHVAVAQLNFAMGERRLSLW